MNGGAGVISGTPPAEGISNVIIMAANTSGTDEQVLTIALYATRPPAPAITSALTAVGTAGAALNYLVTATNTPTRYLAIGWPPGLSCNPSRPTISGVPLPPGTFNAILHAGNQGGTGSGTLELRVLPACPIR